MRQQRIKAPRVAIHLTQKLKGLSKRRAWLECDKCGKVHVRTKGQHYTNRKAADKAGGTYTILCNQCFGKSKAEVNEAQINLASVEQTKRAIALLKKAKKFKAARLLEEKLKEK